MNYPHELPFDLQLLWRSAIERPRRWLIPAAAVAALAFAYAVVRPSTWEASQALVVRDEAVGRVFAPGKFASVDDMQTAQKTVLELATSAGVIETALTQVGPRRGRPGKNWPSPEDVEQLRGSISVTAPRGAEFGRTEVFYLNVKSNDRQRAITLATAVCDALEARLSKLRDHRAQSLVVELQKTVNLTHGDLAQATARLSRLESQLASDVAELRILNESSSGESPLRQTITRVRNDILAEEAVQLGNQQLLDVLVETQGDAARLIATPNRLLESQPALKRLKDGLVDAQLRTAQALGNMSPAHPKVRAAMEEEEDVRRRLRGELDAAIAGLRVELEMNVGRIASLNKQLAELHGRMGRVAAIRPEYNNVMAEVRQRTESWNKAQKDLADAQASRAAAHSASLLTRLDAPRAGAHPQGPSRTLIVLAGLAGGLAVGLGVIVLTATPVFRTNAPVAVAAAAEHASRPRVVTQEIAVEQPAPRRPAPRQATSSGLSLKEALRRIALGAN
jgi:uncharacterized protein involved in exopolysaccharide biosynthesis